jgi:hypothetical protein
MAKLSDYGERNCRSKKRHRAAISGAGELDCAPSIKKSAAGWLWFGLRLSPKSEVKKGIVWWQALW